MTFDINSPVKLWDGLWRLPRVKSGVVTAEHYQPRRRFGVRGWHPLEEPLRVRGCFSSFSSPLALLDRPRSDAPASASCTSNASCKGVSRLLFKRLEVNEEEKEEEGPEPVRCPTPPTLSPNPLNLNAFVAFDEERLLAFVEGFRAGGWRGCTAHRLWL